MISVKLFAVIKDRVGTSELHFSEIPATVSDLLVRIAGEYPSLADMLVPGRVMVSINQEFVRQETPVKDGDEVALMPPFSGGSSAKGGVRVQRDPFSIEREIEILKNSSMAIGAVVSFLGTTRDISKDREVAKLEFEHYPGMAEKKLAEIRERAIRDYQVIDATIIHRIGVIPVGGDIVLIAVASGHRDEAFRACRFCIDELKRITPIWKRETTPEGEEWVEEHP